MTREEEITNAALDECTEHSLDYKWAFIHGAKWADEHPRPLWKDAQGDDLPEIDREVIVIDKMGKVCFGHRPNPKGWMGISAIDGEKDYYVPKTYGKGGWNIPDVKWYLDLDLPNMEEEQ